MNETNILERIENKVDKLDDKLDEFSQRLVKVETNYSNLKWILGVGIGVIIGIFGLIKIL